MFLRHNFYTSGW